MNSLKQTIPDNKPEVRNKRKVKWIDEDKKQLLVTIINPSRDFRAKSSKISGTGKKKFVSVKKDLLDRIDFIPVKKEYIKLQSYINYTEELNNKKFITKLSPYNLNGQKKDLKIITYFNKKSIDKGQRKRRKLLSAADTREGTKRSISGEIGNSYSSGMNYRPSQFPRIRHNERINHATSNFIYSTDLPKLPKSSAWYPL